MEDKTLICKDCEKEFIFSVQEQEFFAEKGFQNEPTRCLACRKVRKQKFNKGERQYYTAICANCGVETQVPFKPTGIKPVYCRDCFQK